MQYTIVNDDVEVAPIYRCNGKDSQPPKPFENHGLDIEHLPTQIATVEVIGSPCTRIIGKAIQNPGDTEMHITSAARLRIDTAYNNNKIKD